MESISACVVFADLTGSVSAYESLGNNRAAQIVTELTQWLDEVFRAHGAEFVKQLGDGVLAIFPRTTAAMDSVVAIQLKHHQRLIQWPEDQRLKIKIGVASGDLVVVGMDYYGDSVNVASRLSDMAQGEEIWVSESVIDELPIETPIRYRKLGPLRIRGRSEAQMSFAILWQDDETKFNLMTHHASGMNQELSDSEGLTLTLRYLDQEMVVAQNMLPLHLGRAELAEFVVLDPHVSRLHAKIEWKNNALVLTDTSSFGTWVKFDNSQTVVALRRQECVLHTNAQIALGLPFNDITAPCIELRLHQLPT